MLITTLKKTALSVEHNSFLDHSGTEGRVITGEIRQRVRNNKGAQLRYKILRGLLEIIKSTALLFILLAVYRISGLSDWWIQLMGHFFK